MVSKPCLSCHKNALHQWLSHLFTHIHWILHLWQSDPQLLAKFYLPLFPNTDSPGWPPDSPEGIISTLAIWLTPVCAKCLVHPHRTHLLSLTPFMTLPLLSPKDSPLIWTSLVPSKNFLNKPMWWNTEVTGEVREGNTPGLLRKLLLPERGWHPPLSCLPRYLQPLA